MKELENKVKTLEEQILIYKEMEKIYKEQIEMKDEIINQITKREHALREKLGRIYGEVKDF